MRNKSQLPCQVNYDYMNVIYLHFQFYPQIIVIFNLLLPTFVFKGLITLTMMAPEWKILT